MGSATGYGATFFFLINNDNINSWSYRPYLRAIEKPKKESTFEN